jgi:hypothetical protein
MPRYCESFKNVVTVRVLPAIGIALFYNGNATLQRWAKQRWAKSRLIWPVSAKPYHQNRERKPPSPINHIVLDGFYI